MGLPGPEKWRPGQGQLSRQSSVEGGPDFHGSIRGGLPGPASQSVGETAPPLGQTGGRAGRALCAGRPAGRGGLVEVKSDCRESE